MSSAVRRPNLTRRGLHRRRGAVAIIVGLALDRGKLYVTRSEPQNSADACALSAAHDLTSAIGLTVAEADGIAALHHDAAAGKPLFLDGRQRLSIIEPTRHTS